MIKVVPGLPMGRPLTNLFDAESPSPFSKKKKSKVSSSPQRTGVAKQTKQTRTASIESILSLFQRVKLDRCLTLDEACVSTAHADNYDFSNKLLQQGDCVHIVHEDAQSNFTTSCIAYVLGKHEEDKIVESSVESPKDMFVCVILLRPESIARGRLP